MAEQISSAEAESEPLLDTSSPTADGGNATLDPDAVFADDAAPVAGSEVDSGARGQRFDGDTSALAAPVCWALQELVGAPHVSESSKHWPVVLQHEDTLRSRLSELGLLLEIDHERRFAFTKQADDPGPRSRKLLRARTLSLAASTLALHLYQQYLVSADDPIIETADMVDHMMAYKPHSDTDEAAFEKKVHTAIRSLEDAAIIRRVNGTERFLIHSVITSIITAEQLATLEQRYRAIARGEATTAPESDDEDSDNDEDETEATGRGESDDD